MEPNSYHAFISYASGDLKLAEAVQSQLVAAGSAFGSIEQGSHPDATGIARSRPVVRLVG